MGQNPKLPHRNIDGRFTSISGHNEFYPRAGGARGSNSGPSASDTGRQLGKAGDRSPTLMSPRSSNVAGDNKYGLDNDACRNGEGARDHAQVDTQLSTKQRQYDEQTDQDCQPVWL